MATQPQTQPKPKTVAEDFPTRSIFANPEDAAAFLNAQGESLSDLGDQTFASAGVDGEGNFDPQIYNPDMRVMVSILRNRGEKDSSGNRGASTVKAIVIAPIPTLDSLLSDAPGREWVQKIIDKELNHVAVRPLRDSDNVAAATAEIPTSRDSYISSSRESSGALDAFNTLYKSLNASLSSKSAPWARARLTKGELKKALESTAYAREYYPTLEDRGDKPSLFVLALGLLQAAAKRDGLDPSIFQRWTETRDAAKLPEAGDDESDDDDIDVDALAAEIKAAPTTPATPAPAEQTPPASTEGQQESEQQPQA